jgi:hypothetical protein
MGRRRQRKLVDGCGYVFDISHYGTYLITLLDTGDRLGIFEYSLAQESCTPLVPGEHASAVRGEQ